MAKRQGSMDGFVPRRATRYAGEHHLPRPIKSGEVNGLTRHNDRNTDTEKTSTLAPSQHGLLVSDIDASLSDIDKVDKQPQPKVEKKKRSIPRRRLIKIFAVLLIFGLIAMILWVGSHMIVANNNIFKGDILGFVQNKPLKADAQGRSNFLLLGTSEDNEGHEGAYLTDSMMVLSLNQKTHDAYMFSIPRDLYVKYGRACNSGYAGKINEYFNCVNEDYTTKEAEQQRLNETKSFIGNILGMELHYGVHTNYTVVRDLVGAVGGIKVKIESPDPRGIMDANFDWKCGAGDPKVSRAERIRRCPPNGHFIDYPNGWVDLDAEHALYLAQARGAGGEGTTYGLPNSNFDREKNQQKIIVALRDKAVSTGTLTNVGKVTGLVNALGDNLRTDIETGELRTLIDVGQKIDSKAIKSVELNGTEEPVLTTDFVGGASVVVPVAGTYDYSHLRSYIKKHVYATPVSKEAANIVVLNGSGVAGVALEESEKLAELGMEIISVENAPSQDYENNQLFHIGDPENKPATKAHLEKLYSTTVTTATPPITVAEGVNFIIIIGASSQSAE